MDPEIREDVVKFLRDWLPEVAREGYREMIERDPEGWHRHPHFAQGVIVRHALRGNGFSEKLLGVSSLAPYWADLLARAVREKDDGPPPPGQATSSPRSGPPAPPSRRSPG